MADRAQAGWVVHLSGPHARGVQWQLHGLSSDLVEVRGLSSGMPTSQLARLERDATGKVVALRVCSSRIRELHFPRQ
jgi:hypothetical protein